MENLEIVFDLLPNNFLIRLVIDGLHAHGIADYPPEHISFVFANSPHQTIFRLNDQFRP
jgi:hypothetical protein